MTFREHLRHILTGQKQMSESFVLSLILAFSGGFQDAYTYIVREHVFANAQTGNLVLMSTNFLEGEYQMGFRYLLPLLAFVLGVFVSIHLDHLFHESTRLHWRQVVVVIEILILTGVGFMPESLNIPANILVSFTCAMQVQAFRTVGGNTYASTMIIGNLRSGTEALAVFIRKRDKAHLLLLRDYFGVILVFALGAGIGGVVSKSLGLRSIWISAGILLLAVLMMELDRQSLRRRHRKKTPDGK